MSCELTIGPVNENIETELKLTFGNKVPLDRVIEFAKRNTNLKEKCGLITNKEAIEIIEEVEMKMKGLQGH